MSEVGALNAIERVRFDLQNVLYNLTDKNLADDAIVTSKIKDLAVTLDKLAQEVRQRIMVDAW